jgi:hypothetical protein
MYRPVARQRFDKQIPAGANARNNRTFIARRRINKQAISIINKLCFLLGPCQGIIKRERMSIELIFVKNWVQFWRWQSKVTEKNWQEMNYTAKKS